MILLITILGKPELEKHDVIGPIFTNTNSSRDLDKKKLLETHPELKEQILDINSFYALSFLAQDSGGQERLHQTARLSSCWKSRNSSCYLSHQKRAND